jgi:hypothetical protein
VNDGNDQKSGRVAGFFLRRHRRRPAGGELPSSVSHDLGSNPCGVVRKRGKFLFEINLVGEEGLEPSKS